MMDQKDRKIEETTNPYIKQKKRKDPLRVGIIGFVLSLGTLIFCLMTYGNLIDFKNSLTETGIPGLLLFIFVLYGTSYFGGTITILVAFAGMIFGTAAIAGFREKNGQKKVDKVFELVLGILSILIAVADIVLLVIFFVKSGI